MTSADQPQTPRHKDQDQQVPRDRRDGDGTPERGGPGTIDSTGAGSGRMTISGVEPSPEEEHAQDRGAGKDGPTPNPAIVAP